MIYQRQQTSWLLQRKTSNCSHERRHILFLSVLKESTQHARGSRSRRKSERGRLMLESAISEIWRSMCVALLELAQLVLVNPTAGLFCLKEHQSTKRRKYLNQDPRRGEQRVRYCAVEEAYGQEHL